MVKHRAILFAAIVLIGFFCILPIDHICCADSLYVKKIVMLVLDDSGSMNGSNRWEYAIYSLQNLAAMMNPGDTLFVSTLSANQPVAIDVSDRRIESSLNQIRSIPFGGGGTPFEPVITAFDHLKAQPSPDASTEYWLIVLTDGQFSGVEPYQNAGHAFSSFISETMPNGSNPKIIYLNIGNTSNTVHADQGKGLFSYSAPGTGEVIDAMAQISDMISGRRRFGKDEYLAVNDHSVSISSPDIPLANIIVMVQNSDAGIRKVFSDTKVYDRGLRMN